MTLSNANGFGFTSGWIVQALRCIPDIPDIFSKPRIDQAMDYFGLGNKKVEALQFWIRAAGLAQLVGGNMVLTPLGEAVRRYDPHCEIDSTWWFMHTQLSRIKRESGLRDSSTWRWYALGFGDQEFTKDRLRSELAATYPGAAARTVISAVNELVNSLQNCPLGQMGLMCPVADGYVRQSPQTQTVHPAVVGYAILLWAADRGRSRETVHLHELSRGSEAVSRLFGWSETKLVDALERLSSHYGPGVFAFHRTAALNSCVLFESDPLVMIKAHYHETVNDLSPRQALEASRGD